MFSCVFQCWEPLTANKIDAMIRSDSTLYTYFLCFQTYVANVLIALNPYENILQLYGPDQVTQYLTNKNSPEKPPHIYHIGTFSHYYWSFIVYPLCNIRWFGDLFPIVEEYSEIS